jgi:hypothetical protein
MTDLAVRLITKTSIYWEKDADFLDVTQAVGSLQEQLYFARKENGKKQEQKLCNCTAYRGIPPEKRSL